MAKYSKGKRHVTIAHNADTPRVMSTIIPVKKTPNIAHLV